MGFGRKYSQILKNSSSMKLNAVLLLSPEPRLNECFLQELVCDLNTVLCSTILLWKVNIWVGTPSGKFVILSYDESSINEQMLRLQ